MLLFIKKIHNLKKKITLTASTFFVVNVADLGDANVDDLVDETFNLFVVSLAALSVATGLVGDKAVRVVVVVVLVVVVPERVVRGFGATDDALVAGRVIGALKKHIFLLHLNL